MAELKVAFRSVSKALNKYILRLIPFVLRFEVLNLDKQNKRVTSQMSHNA